MTQTLAHSKAGGIHKAAYIQPADPALDFTTFKRLRADILWFDTSATPYVLKKRNAANTGWDIMPLYGIAAGASITDLHINVKSAPYNAKGDVVVSYIGACTATSTTITGASGLTSADVGKRFVLQGGGVAGAPLAGTISAVLSATSFTASVAASTTAAVRNLYWGTDDTAAIQSAIDAAPAHGQVAFPLSGRGYLVTHLSITRPVSLIGYGGVQHARIGPGGLTANRDDVQGVVLRAGTNQDVLAIVNTQDVKLENLVVDGARIAPYAVKLDRARFCYFAHYRFVRGATAGLIIGSSSLESFHDGSYWNTFIDGYVDGASGVKIAKFDGGAAGGYHNRFYALVIEFWGQGSSDCGFGVYSGDNNSVYDLWSWDHTNVAPRPALYIDGPYVDASSAFDTRIYGAQLQTSTVAAGNPKAGMISGLDLANILTLPVIGAGSKLDIEVPVSAGLGFNSYRDYNGTMTLRGGLGAFPRAFNLNLFSAHDAEYNGIGFGQSPANGYYDVIMGMPTNNDFFPAEGSLGFSVRVRDATRQINFGFGDGTAAPTLRLTSSYGQILNAVKGDMTAPDGDSRLTVWDVSAGTFKRVHLGPAGSGPGGVGRVLYVDN